MHLDPVYEGDSVLTRVRIDDFPRMTGTSTSFIAVPLDDARVPRRIRLSWQAPPVELRVGDIWQLELRLRRPRGAMNPGGMDFEAWLFRERIGATGYVVSGRHNHLMNSDAFTGVMRLRAGYVDRVERRFGDSDAAAVVIAVAVGARHLISRAQWDRYARTGTTHLMAISGLHVGLAVAFAYLATSAFFGAFGVGRPHYAALVAAFACALVYTLLSGFAVPARRALLMCGLATIALLSGREIRGARVLAATGLIIVTTDMLATMQPGFKLSFAAVALLIWTAGRMRMANNGSDGRMTSLFRGFATLQFALLLGLMPLTILEFDRVSISAPVVNFFAIPLFTFVTVPAALVSVLELGAISDAALSIAVVSVEWLDAALVYVAALPVSSHVTASIEGIAWLLVFLPLAWVVLPPGWPGRVVAICGAAALLAWRPPAIPEQCIDLTMLDVGHGLSVVVQTEDRVLVYDTGNVSVDGDTAAESVIVPFLRQRGVRRIDLLVVSHADADHAGGLNTIVEQFDVGEIIAGEAIDGIGAAQCRRGEVWQWSKARLSVLHPADATLAGNDASCVVVIEIGDYRAMLTGDIEKGTESMLVRRRELPEVDIVTVPHHGSRTSSTSPFIRSLGASYALVSAAHGNHWGFPKPDVVARWRSSGATVLTTASSGAIALRVCSDAGINLPRETRKQRRRLWRSHDS